MLQHCENGENLHEAKQTSTSQGGLDCQASTTVKSLITYTFSILSSSRRWNEEFEVLTPSKNCRPPG